MRAAIYCRVSSARQNAEGKVSMEDQEERCRAVCATKGWDIVAVYDEGDASAGTVHRGEFQRMIAAARAGEFDVIVAREVSRLSRVAQARRAIEELIVEWGLSVCNARTGMVYSEADGLGASLMWTVEAKMAEAEWAERSFRTTMGMRGKAEKGVVPGAAAPYGYRWTGGEGSTLVVDEESADTIRRIFELAADGTSCPAIAATLNDGSVPSPGGRDGGWVPGTIHNIVRRTAYIGEHTYGKEHWRKLNSERDRQEWAREFQAKKGVPPPRIPAKVKEPGEHVYPVTTPVIVDRELWERANTKLRRTKKNHPDPRRVWMLQGLLRCEECGEPMKVTWGLKGEQLYFYYRCVATKRGDRPPCRVGDGARGLRKNLPALETEARVWQLVDDMLSDPEVLAAAVGTKIEEAEAAAPMVDERIERHERRLEKSTRALDAARRMLLEGEVDEEAYRRDRAHYDAEIAMLREELARMREAADDRSRQQTEMEAITALSSRWGEIRGALTDAERRELVWALLTDVTVTRDDKLTVAGALEGLRGWIVSGDGGRYWIRTSDLCDVNAAL